MAEVASGATLEASGVLEEAVRGLVTVDDDGNPVALTPAGLLAARAMLAREHAHTAREFLSACASLASEARRAARELQHLLGDVRQHVTEKTASAMDARLANLALLGLFVQQQIELLTVE